MHIVSPRLLVFALAVSLTALTAASAASGKRGAGCSVHDPFGRAPQATTAPLDAAVLASYGVLRRAATAADRPPPINSLADQVIGLGRYDPAYIRQLTQRPGGRRVFLVPGFPVHVEIPPARCLPRELRARRPMLVAQQREREREPIACVVSMSARAGGFGSSTFGIAVGVGGWTAYAPLGCPRFRDLTRYESLTTSGLEGLDHSGVLPDEIASLRVRFSRSPTVQVPVVENFYAYKGDPALRTRLLRQLRRLSQRVQSHRTSNTQRRRLTRELLARTRHAASVLSPIAVELLAADGRVIKTVKRPRLGVAGAPSELPVAVARCPSPARDLRDACR